LGTALGCTSFAFYFKQTKLLIFGENLNSSDRSRTCDLGLMNPALYQLSYAAVCFIIGKSIREVAFGKGGGLGGHSQGDFRGLP
jgi:hypothetical protein